MIKRKVAKGALVLFSLLLVFSCLSGKRPASFEPSKVVQSPEPAARQTAEIERRLEKDQSNQVRRFAGSQLGDDEDLEEEEIRPAEPPVLRLTPPISKSPTPSMAAVRTPKPVATPARQSLFEQLQNLSARPAQTPGRGYFGGFRGADSSVKTLPAESSSSQSSSSSSSSSTPADPGNRGVSALGLCSPRFDCSVLLSAFQEVSVMLFGWLDNTFSDSCDCGEKLLADPRPKVVRIHIANYPCLRNKRCGPYEIFYGESKESAETKVLAKEPHLMERFHARWLAVRRQIANAKNIRLLISNCLECGLSPLARSILISRARSVFPSAEFVDNPGMNAGPCLPGTICEYHGDRPPAGENYILDTDGVDFHSVDRALFEPSQSSALMVLMWTYSLSGINPGVPFEDPRDRTAFANESDITFIQDWLHSPLFPTGE